MLKAIVFDLDGVIVDSEPLHYRAFLSVARRHGIDFDYARYLDRYIGYDDRDGFRAMFTESQNNEAAAVLDDSQILNLCQQKAQAFEDAATHGVEAMAGVRTLIDQASTEVPLAIATGATRMDAQLLLKHLGIESYFDPVVAADDVTYSKPDPETYRLAVHYLDKSKPQLQIRPHDCLAIEDTDAGVRSAQAAGLRTLGVATTGPAEKLRRAHRVIESLENITLSQLHEWFD